MTLIGSPQLNIGWQTKIALHRPYIGRADRVKISIPPGSNGFRVMPGQTFHQTRSDRVTPIWPDPRVGPRVGPDPLDSLLSQI